MFKCFPHSDTVHCGITIAPPLSKIYVCAKNFAHQSESQKVIWPLPNLQSNAHRGIGATGQSLIVGAYTRKIMAGSLSTSPCWKWRSYLAQFVTNMINSDLLLTQLLWIGEIIVNPSPSFMYRFYVIKTPDRNFMIFSRDSSILSYWA